MKLLLDTHALLWWATLDPIIEDLWLACNESVFEDVGVRRYWQRRWRSFA